MIFRTSSWSKPATRTNLPAIISQSSKRKTLKKSSTALSTTRTLHPPETKLRFGSPEAHFNSKNQLWNPITPIPKWSRVWLRRNFLLILTIIWEKLLWRISKTSLPSLRGSKACLQGSNTNQKIKRDLRNREKWRSLFWALEATLKRSWILNVSRRLRDKLSR